MALVRHRLVSWTQLGQPGELPADEVARAHEVHIRHYGQRKDER